MRRVATEKPAKDGGTVSAGTPPEENEPVVDDARRSLYGRSAHPQTLSADAAIFVLGLLASSSRDAEVPPRAAATSETAPTEALQPHIRPSIDNIKTKMHRQNMLPVSTADEN